MAEYLFSNFALLDPEAGKLKSGYQVLVRDNVIEQVERGVIRAPKAETVDCRGRVLMPGLIDCHNHATTQVLAGPPTMLPSLNTAHALSTLGRMLQRGFTTFRDCAGADLGHKMAIEKGLFPGPRLFVSGRALSQTGGHADPRVRAEQRSLVNCCVHLEGGLGRVADGVAEVRAAVRDEIRLGADQIKLMASGGIASASDPIDQVQYSQEELRAAVDEAERSNTYCMAHCYPDTSIRHCVEAGVRTIEHGSFLTEDTAKLMARAGAYLVPTLIGFRLLGRFGAKLGYNAEQMEKTAYVLSAGTKALVSAKAAGVKMAYGTDIGYFHDYQSEEFLVRAEVLTPAEIIRSATTIGAEVVRMVGKLGVIAPGAFADLLVVDGDPFKDLGLFQGQGKHLSFIMANGRLAKNRLN